MVEILKFLRSLADRNSSAGPFSSAPRYDDAFWPWVRTFFRIWAGIMIVSGVTLCFEVAVWGLASELYVYAFLRFWAFYVPVFGLSLHLYFRKYSGDGVWWHGPSYVTYARSVVRDFWLRFEVYRKLSAHSPIPV